MSLSRQEAGRLETALFVLRLSAAALFIVAGLRKLLGFAGTSQWLGSLGLPYPEVLTAAVVVLEVVAGAAVALGWGWRWAAIALAAFTVLATPIGHPVWADASHLNDVLKNHIILAALVVIAIAGPGRWALAPSAASPEAGRPASDRPPLPDAG